MIWIKLIIGFALASILLTYTVTELRYKNRNMLSVVLYAGLFVFCCWLLLSDVILNLI